MNLAVDHVWVLLLLGFCWPALLGGGAVWRGVSSLVVVPADGVSRALDLALRVLAAGAIAGVVLGLAGLHRAQSSVELVGRGAHIVLLLDRSLSMDEKFAVTGHRATATKTEAAAKLIEAFFACRPHDKFGLVAFSTAPIVVMPLTDHREAMAGAMAAMQQKGLADTDIGSGLITALDLFKHDDPQAERVLLFMSDGAGYIPNSKQDLIRASVLRERIHLYYLYLRAGDEPALTEQMGDNNDPAHPAVLNAFFKSLGVPYRGFEASEPTAVVTATDEIGKIETRPIAYSEMVPRVDYRGWCYGLAAGCLLLVLLAQLAERDFGMWGREI